MDIISGHSMAFTGMYLVDRAKKLARKILQRRLRSKIESQDGYLIMAKASGKRSTGTVMDLPGGVFVLATDNDPKEFAEYLVGTRDAFDSRSGITDGPYTQAEAKSSGRSTTYYAIGFDGTPPPGAFGNVQSIYHRSWLSGYRSIHASRGHALTGLTSFSVPDAGSPFLGLSVPGSVGFAEVLRPMAPGGYVIADTHINVLCPGYMLIRSSAQGYVGSEYQTMPPAAVRIGTMTVAAIPVSKRLGTGAEDWGSAAVLFVGLDSTAARAENPEASGDDIGVLSVRWHFLWEAASHPSAALRPGQWDGMPDWEPAFSDRGWYDFFTSKTVSGGSRPNWIDGINCANDGDEAVFRFRMVTMCGVFVSSGDYPVAGAEAVIEARVTAGGSVTVSYPHHEVFAAAGSPVSPIYSAFVAGDTDLSAMVVRSRVPMALLETPEGLARIDWVCTADRADFRDGAAVAAEMENPDLANCGLQIVSPQGTRLVRFSTLGAGIHGPIIGITDGAGGTRRVIMPATLSYTLWHPHTRFAMVSDKEIGFLVSDHWDWYNNVGAPSSAVSLAVFNLETGAATKLGAVGFQELADVEHKVGPRLSVIQRKIVDAAGETVIEGVYLVATKYSLPVRITRDSGLTWSDYLTWPAAGGGAYYLGNPLMTNMQPGAAIK